jgi:hypothetical protein
MAKLKISELVAATETNPSDLLYLVQSGASKSITVANFLADITDPTLKGNIKITGTPQTLSSGGIVDISTPTTYLSIGGTAADITIPNGATGQLKILLTTSTSGGSYTLRSNIANNANILFANVGDTATILYTNSKWFMIGGTARLV